MGAQSPWAVFVVEPDGSKDYQLMEGTKMLGDWGFNTQTVCPQAPVLSHNPPTESSGDVNHPTESDVLRIPCGITTC